MTDAAIARRDIRSFGRNDFATALIPSAIFCGVVFAASASFLNWKSSARRPTPSVAVASVTPARTAPIQTWVIERPRAESLEAEASDRADAAAAAAFGFSRVTEASVAVLAAAKPLPTPPIVASVPAGDDKPAAAAAPPASVVPSVSDRFEKALEKIPLPPPRPAFLPQPREEPVRAPSQGRRRLARQTTGTSASAPEDNRSFLEKLFGVSPQPSRTALAYAPPNGGGGLGGLFGRKASFDRQTAIYEIATHTVYLPDGRRLEAHSGLGEGLDDPRSVSQRMRGATPPNIYALTPREELFHGVKALRLTPVGSGETYGRNGLLAHTYMLGPRGDSNGCVAFRDYDAFLQAYESGAIKRLAVVANMN